MRSAPQLLGATFLLALTGCPSPLPPTGFDVGARDAARADASSDASVDASADVGADAGSDDGGPAVDAPVDARDASCGQPLGTDCSATACATGQTCAPDVCGMHCLMNGSGCVTDTDCPTGATCSDGRCASSTPSACVDSRTCPLGFACEAGACVDRRFPCAADGSCPFGYACDRALAGGTCVRLSRRCASSTACAATLSDHQVCVDVDGDGNDECQFSDGSCVVNADCSGGQNCTSSALSGVASCGRFGVCHDATNCSVGQQCRDLWGDGVRECVDSGGCTTTASCPPHQVCATAAAGGAPICAGG